MLVIVYAGPMVKCSDCGRNLKTHEDKRQRRHQQGCHSSSAISNSSGSSSSSSSSGSSSNSSSSEANEPEHKGISGEGKRSRVMQSVEVNSAPSTRGRKMAAAADTAISALLALGTDAADCSTL